MALHSGFFVSIAGDKRYNTAQMSEIFDGIINDGVFQSIGTCLMAEAASGMTVNIGIGRAWFNHTWTLNDAPLPLTLEASELVLDRIDTVVLRVDHREAVRDNFIEIIKGTPATEPVPANLVDTDETFYHPLAYIYVASGVTEITQSNITNNVGSTDVPFVTGILETVSTEALITQWAAEWVEWLARIQNEGTQFMSDSAEEFNEWFENLQYVLDGDVAGHLQNEINDLQDDTAELADTLGVWLGSYEIPLGATSYTITSDEITASALIDIYITDSSLPAFMDAEATPSRSGNTLTITFANPLANAVTISNVHVAYSTTGTLGKTHIFTTLCDRIVDLQQQIYALEDLPYFIPVRSLPSSDINQDAIYLLVRTVGQDECALDQYYWFENQWIFIGTIGTDQYALITREGQMTSPSESKTVMTSIYPRNPNYRAKVILSANGNFERWITTDSGTTWDLAEGDLAGATVQAGLRTFVLNSPYYKASGWLYEFIVSDATVDVASEYGMKAQITDGSATLTFDNPLPSDVVIENVHIRKYNV